MTKHPDNLAATATHQWCHRALPEGPSGRAPWPGRGTGGRPRDWSPPREAAGMTTTDHSLPGRVLETAAPHNSTAHTVAPVLLRGLREQPAQHHRQKTLEELEFEPSL